ncbi:Retrovirus-related Pol polyprotein from transposon TNT 1-94 [Vitis vinifera]|uniref:Retrovirus-related Pol polyprotein from transposon TNT 1-94 n=1 Tax=Vitis vinifera TaxID=29760 RepID=A0A438GQ68_VITVI|nr:Retrovirus-related Pol polyprotein from transposon TNT 1-94 [Vitis vinifera]
MYLYILHNKNEALDAFKVFKVEVEKQCGKQIKIVRSDRGGEYYGRYMEDAQSPGPFAKFLQEHGIVAQYTLLGSPYRNGVAERKTELYWTCSNQGYPKTPFELWKGWKSSLRHLCIWGCSFEVRIYNPQEKKLDPRTISGYFIGYAEKSKGYIFYCPFHNTRIMESRNAKFLEYDLVNGSDQFRNIVSDIDHTESQPSTSSDRLFIVHNIPQVQMCVERTIVEVQPVIEVPQTVDNISVDQVDQELLDTSEQQVEPHTSLEDNGVTLRRSTRTKRSTIPSGYDLVELPNGVKAIGCKWVFKTKKDSLGNIERYKAKLVAKGFTKKEGINYTETFSLVSKKDSLCIILSLVAHFDLELQKMDVKTGFLNGELEEGVYMKQPKGFPSSDENVMDQCIYLKVSGSKVCFLILFVDDILLATNDKGLLHEVKQFLSKNFDMKDMGEASYVIDIKIHRDKFQVKGDRFNLNQCLKNELEREQMKNIPYASAVGSLMYAQVYTRPDIAFAIGMLGRHQSNLGYFTLCMEATSQGVWIKSFIFGLRIMDSISRPLSIYCDNSTVVFMSKNNKSGSRSKHIDIKHLAIRERVQERKVVIEHISIELMIADPLTKGMPLLKFKDHVVNMGLSFLM